MAFQRMDYVTLIKLRPGAGRPGSVGAEPYENAWEEIRERFLLLGAKVSLMKNVLGNDYDLLVIGEVVNQQSLHQIDAAFKALGYEAKTHPAIDAGEYARLARRTNELLDRGRAEADAVEVGDYHQRDRNEAMMARREAGDSGANS